MEVLFIVPYTPNLIRTRSYNLIRALSSRGNRITLATLWSSQVEHESVKRLEPYCKAIYTLPMPAWRSMMNCLLAFPTSQPLQATYCWQPGLARIINEISNSSNGHGKFDVVHVEHLRGVKYGLKYQSNVNRKRSFEASRAPVVWDSVDNISYLFRQSSAQSKRKAFRWLTKLELKRTEKYEAWLLSQFSRILVTSQKDKDEFLTLLPVGVSSENITVIPNGVDLEYFSPDPLVEREPATLVVSGKMSYHANVSMVMYLVESIMPKIWQHRPDTQLWIVGKDPSKEIKALSLLPNVTVTGTVEDVRPYLRRAAVAVAPLTYGAGIQNKILESMSCATPVVASQGAVLGLNNLQGCEILVARDAAEFANNVIRLLEHKELRAAVGNAGRQFVEEHYHWAEISKKLEGIYHAVNKN